ncbi:hypothetical protein TNCV_646871 [Trichonephila clavipes]|nr:hypothetical protein TNCV_646871 [Trichonephila clavipes]
MPGRSALNDMTLPKCIFQIARSSCAIICVFLGRPDPSDLRRYLSQDPPLPTPSNYHIVSRPEGVAADTSIRPTWASSRGLLPGPLSKSVSCSYCRRLRLRGILKSQYRLSKS